MLNYFSLKRFLFEEIFLAQTINRFFALEQIKDEMNY